MHLPPMSPGNRVCQSLKKWTSNINYHQRDAVIDDKPILQLYSSIYIQSKYPDIVLQCSGRLAIYLLQPGSNFICLSSIQLYSIRKTITIPMEVIKTLHIPSGTIRPYHPYLYGIQLSTCLCKSCSTDNSYTKDC